MHALGRQLVQLQILEQVDPVDHQHDLVNGRRDLRIGIRRDLHREIVRADQHRILTHQPLGGGDAEAGTSLHVARVVLGPKLAPPGVDDHRIAWLQREVLSLQRLLQIRYRDLVVVGQHVGAFERGDVDQHAARDERADVLDAQLREARPGRDLVELEAVVEAVLDRLVGEAVELRAHLADLGQDHLFVAAASIRLGVHERPLDVHVESPRARNRHVGREHVADLDDLAGADQAGRAQHGLGLHVVARPALVAGAPLRGAPLAVRRGPPRLSVERFAEQNERRGQGNPGRDVSHGPLLRSVVRAAPRICRTRADVKPARLTPATRAWYFCAVSPSWTRPSSAAVTEGGAS